MRLIVITLVSILGYAFGDVLKVRCGDELCEKPSNRAVTKLKYAPDKAYKLQIFSVNTEVEIFGATDDLYYAKYGRNFGFIPKNNLREISRGNFQHNVEINFDNIKLLPEIKETNYLHQVAKSSHSTTQNSSESSTGSADEVKEQIVEQQENAENKAESPKTEEERPIEYIPIGTEPKVPEPQPANVTVEEVKTEDKPNESESVPVEDKKLVEPEVIKEEKLTEEPTVITEKQSQDTQNDSGLEDDDDEGEDDEEDDESDIFDSTEQTTETASTEVPETTPMPKVEQVEQNDTLATEPEIKSQELPQIVEEPVKIEEVPPVPIEPQQSIEVINNEELASANNDTVEIPKQPEPAQDIPEFKEIPTEKPQEPAPVVEEVIEEKVEEVTTTPVPIVDEIPPPVIEETTTALPEIVTELPDVKQGFTTEVPQTPPSQVKREIRIEQDMLLKRFDQKLGHKSSDGVGSVEQVHKHFHDQSHDHIQPHDHSHLSNVDDKTDQISKEEVSEDEQDKKPGFFGGLVKKIFGDEHDKHQYDTKQTIDEKSTSSENADDEGFCEKIDSENCPKSLTKSSSPDNQHTFVNSNTVEEYLKMMLSEAVEMMDVIITMSLVAVTVLIFIFGHYCISKASKEGELIKRMNVLERELMASTKENGSLKAEVEISKQQLKSIKDNSFGSNDMVIALKQDLELSEREKEELLDKVSALEKELEAAAEDGLELNKMVSELLNNQTGSDSIISSVEDLQKQLNEQQETIVTMNEALAAKSRENTELQIQLSDINNRFSGEFEKFQQQIDAISLERSNLQIELENIKRESDMQINQIIEERNSEVTRLNNELTSYAGKYDENKKLLTATESKLQALEECIETIKKTKGGDIKNLLDVADLKADLLAVTKEKSTIQEQLQGERDSRKLLEDRVKSISDEMSNLKKEFSVAEKEKVDALTRLDVLSNYFKEKETQLQQELSVKEARWMKQQGETTSTVEKVQALNAEIQILKSQNDELKAEYEAQVLSYKAKLTNVEAQSHSAWLTAKQAERKLEESRMEAATLRRRLTSIAENPTASADLLNGLPNDSINSIPSPMRVESPNNISLPPPPLMMPPFLPGAPPFLPPPFMSGDMPMVPGIPPLGRLMSPPPKRFTPTMRDERDRYSPRGRYSPDSRYDDYSQFETETDISPPRSPVPQQRRGYSSPTDRSKKSKGEQPSRRK